MSDLRTDVLADAIRESFRAIHTHAIVQMAPIELPPWPEIPAAEIRVEMGDVADAVQQFRRAVEAMPTPTARADVSVDVAPIVSAISESAKAIASALPPDGTPALVAALERQTAAIVALARAVSAPRSRRITHERDRDGRIKSSTVEES